MRIRKECKLSLYEFLFCACCFLFYFLWAVNKPFNYGPDEYMRYDVSEFLFKNNRLPIGLETANPVWGFSYAHLPTMIRHIFDFVFMKIGSIFSSNDFYILLCARMVSVLCGTLIVLFTIKISKILFKTPIRWLMVGLVAFIPQLAFLSSYVNNDIVALLGATFIMYSWILGIHYNWNFKNSSILAIGIAICATSYYNAYSWILFSVFLFIFTYLHQNNKDYKGLFKYSFFIFLIVFLIAGYFFIRHVAFYGDLLGIKTTQSYCELYGIDALKPSNRLTPKVQGISLIDMLFGNMRFIKDSSNSFVGCFGYMQYPLPGFFYCIYYILFVMAFIGLVGFFIAKVKNKQKERLSIDADKILFGLSLLFCIVITICLSVYNSYANEFQPQGRYCYPALLAIAFFFTKGFDFISNLFSEKYRYAIVGSVTTIFILISLYSYNCIYLPS